MAMNEMNLERMPAQSRQMLNVEMQEKPVQDPIELIKQDHRKVESLFKQFESTQDSRQKLEISKQICLELSVHAQLEEELVYPLLMREDEEVEEEAQLEHELIKFMIGELKGSTARDKGLAPRMKVLKELVEHHVEEEEQEALPELAGNKELKARAQRIGERKMELMDKLKHPRGSSRRAPGASSSGKRTATVKKASGRKSIKPGTGTRKNSKTSRASKRKTVRRRG